MPTTSAIKIDIVQPFATRQIAISIIAIQPDLQPRIAGLDTDHIAVLRESLDTCPPVAVVEQSGRFILVDGFHRLAAAQDLGLDAMNATVVERPADGDLRGLAFRLNSAHGRPLTLADRRAEASRLLKRNPFPVTTRRMTSPTSPS